MNQNELAHYGVKGMKWGVRKDRKSSSSHPSALHPSDDAHPSDSKPGKTRNKGSSPTKSPLSQKLSSPFKKAGMMAAVGVHPSKVANPLKLAVLPEKDSPGDIVFKKGSIVQHVMATPDKDLNRHLFVAATDADKANYGGFFAALSRYRNNNADMYKMELTAKEALVSPNKKKRVDEFLKLYEEDKSNISRELAEFNKREYGGYFKGSVEKYTKQFENMSTKQLKTEGYYTFYNSLFSSDYNRNAYFDRLKKQGYNSVIDDNDKRSFMQAKAPLIVFNAYDSLEKTKISELPMDEIKQNMVDWSMMKHGEVDDMDGSEFVLAHYGVKGMKWGVRKDRKPGLIARARAKKESKFSEDYANYHAMKKKKSYEMSNAEMKDYLARADLEKRYRNTKADERYVRKFIGSMAEQTVRGVVTGYTIAEGRNIVNKTAGVATSRFVDASKRNMARQAFLWNERRGYR